MKKKTKKKGFTLIEILIGIALLATLVILVVSNVYKAFNEINKDAFVIDARKVLSIAEKENLTEEGMRELSKRYCSGITGASKKLEFLDKEGVYYDVLIYANKIVSYKVSTSKYSIDILSSGSNTVSESDIDTSIVSGSDEENYKSIVCEGAMLEEEGRELLFDPPIIGEFLGNPLDLYKGVYGYLNGTAVLSQVNDGSIEVDKHNFELVEGNNIVTYTYYGKTYERSIFMSSLKIEVKSKTANSITVEVTPTVLGSITNYEFKIGEGNYTSNGTNNIYTFNSLSLGTYIIYSRVTNSEGQIGTANITVNLSQLEVPTYSISPSGEATSKIVTITYPQREEGYVYSYSKDGGVSWATVESGTSADVIFTANGTLIGRVSDGANTVTSSCTVSQIIETFIVSFDYTGTTQTYTVPVSGTYKMEAYGAQGGGPGGKGGYTSGQIALTAGDVITILVGGQNGYNGGGSGVYVGGGSTIIKKSSTSLLTAAGGGGGTAGTVGGNGTSVGGSGSAGTGYPSGSPSSYTSVTGGTGTTGGGGGSGNKYKNCTGTYTDTCYTGSPNACLACYTDVCQTYESCPNSNCSCKTNNCSSSSCGQSCSCSSGTLSGTTCKKTCTKTYGSTTVCQNSCTGQCDTVTCTYNCDFAASCSCKRCTAAGCETYNSCADESCGCKTYVYSSCGCRQDTCTSKTLCSTYSAEIYNSGQGGTNVINASLTNTTSTNGANTGNGKALITYIGG